VCSPEFCWAGAVPACQVSQNCKATSVWVRGPQSVDLRTPVLLCPWNYGGTSGPLPRIHQQQLFCLFWVSRKTALGQGGRFPCSETLPRFREC
jgi:hypothetical protein